MRFVVCLALLLATTRPAGSADAPPVYTRQMWLADSLATADLVVEGEAAGQSLKVRKLRWGRIHPDLRVAPDPDHAIRLCPPYRCDAGSPGVWILVRTREGYLAVNPDTRALPNDEWTSCASRLPAPPNWTEDPEQAFLARRAGQRSLIVAGQGGEVMVEQFIDGVRTLHRSFDDAGRLLSLFRLDEKGDGLSITWDDGRPISYSRYAGGKREGVARDYYRSKPGQMREETHWHNGVRHGLSSTFAEDGQPLATVEYEHGFIAPVVRYHGPPADHPLATIYRNEHGVFYKAAGPLETVFRVGMTIDEVRDRLRLDFSPASGLRFPFYTPDAYLHIAFADGRVSAIRRGSNAVCYER
jgi:hypothetical protein